MAKSMMTLRLDPAEAALDGARRKLGPAPDEIDAARGVVSLSPEQNLYAVMVDDAVAARIGGTGGGRGPFANPGIEPLWTLRT
jgi:hypothetical protein